MKIHPEGLCSSIHKNMSKSVFSFNDVTLTNWCHKLTDCRVISKQCHYGESKIRGLMLFESNTIESVSLYLLLVSSNIRQSS